MASVKQAWIKKYGEIEGLRLWEERKKKSAITEQNLIEKYGEIEGKSRWNSYKNKLKIRGTLDWYIQKYGKVDGTGKYNLKNKKLSVSYGALKLNGFSDFEINEIRNKHANKSVRSIDNFISESGDEMKGVIKYNNYHINFQHVNGIKKPFIQIGDKIVPIFNLHIHSKKLKDYI
jgi:hypothetical protein